jgi:2-keto-4-pentenoate hydratase
VIASTVLADGAAVARTDFIAPKVEAEIVFRLDAPLEGPGVTRDDAVAAVAEVMPGLEIVDSRIEDWRIRIADTVADMASIGAVVLGRAQRVPEGVDLRLTGLVFRRDGEVIATGAGAAALGDPYAVVAWLANTLGEHGVPLEPGQLIMTGALHAAVPMRPGDTFTAEFDRLGTVTLRVGGDSHES